jgi:hypothetical protein
VPGAPAWSAAMAAAERVARLRTGLTRSYTEHGAGDGVPLLLLHAWSESRRAFAPFPARPGRRPGCGTAARGTRS